MYLLLDTFELLMEQHHDKQEKTFSYDYGYPLILTYGSETSNIYSISQN